MDSVIDIDAARALVADVSLWPRVRDFLWDFAAQTHESWLATEDRSAFDCRSLAKTSFRAKCFLLEKLGVEPCFYAFPKAGWSRLALLDGKTLESIAKWLGALACANALRRVTDGATVRELKAALPGVYPEVFAFTAYFAGLKGLETEELKSGAAETVVRAGWRILRSLVKDVPEPVARRLALKLPRNWSAFESSDSQIPPLQSFNLPLLLKLRFPEAYSLCC